MNKNLLVCKITNTHTRKTH